MWHGRESVTSEDAFEIESRASADNDSFVSLVDFFVGFQKVLLILKDVVFCSRFDDVDEVVRNVFPVHHIFLQVFSCSEVHSSIDLPAVCADDFRVKFFGESDSHSGFSGSGGSEDGDEFWKLGHGEWGCDEYIIRYSEVLSIP